MAWLSGGLIMFAGETLSFYVTTFCLHTGVILTTLVSGYLDFTALVTLLSAFGGLITEGEGGDTA